MFDVILVPLDGSRNAEGALETAADLAHRDGATLLLAHADTPGNPIFVEGAPMDEEGFPVPGAHEAAYLQQIQAHLQHTWHIPVDYRVLQQPGASPAELLAACVQADRVGLVVMTTHGRGGIDRLWLGSVVDHLVRVSHAPVLLIRPPEMHSLLPRIRRLLVPLDGSAMAEQILPIAARVAELADAELRLVRVVDRLEEVQVNQFGVVWASPSPQAAQQLEEANAYLDAVQRSLPRRLRLSTQAIPAPSPAEGILEEARSVEGTLVAMTTHARRRLERLLLGSVADKIMRSLSPILLYRPAVEAAL